MSILLNSVLVSFLVLLLLFSCFIKFTNRSSFLNNLVGNAISSSASSLVGNGLIGYLLFIMLVTNLLGNIPLNLIPTMFYSLTLTLSLLFWLPLIICACYTDIRMFLSHMLPYGSPVSLMLFLPLIEVFSQVIRPFTLIIRLSTNLSSGHIMMYMFSYFTLLSSTLTPYICVVLMLMFVLELCISALQAYIFVSLLVLYSSETLCFYS